MDNSIIKVADTFWNIRGSFKLGGRIDIGTQASLVQLASGNFVFLDAYAFDADLKNRSVPVWFVPVWFAERIQ